MPLSMGKSKERKGERGIDIGGERSKQRETDRGERHRRRDRGKRQREKYRGTETGKETQRKR